MIKSSAVSARRSAAWRTASSVYWPSRAYLRVSPETNLRSLKKVVVLDASRSLAPARRISTSRTPGPCAIRGRTDPDVSEYAIPFRFARRALIAKNRGQDTPQLEPVLWLKVGQSFETAGSEGRVIRHRAAFGSRSADRTARRRRAAPGVAVSSGAGWSVMSTWNSLWSAGSIVGQVKKGATFSRFGDA